MSHRTKPGNRAPSSKLGRNKFKCEKYRAENRQQKNKDRRADTLTRNLNKASAAREAKWASVGL